jgi:hypothetical protein
VSPFAIVIADTTCDHGLECAEIFGVEQGRVVLLLEAAMEALDLRVVPRPTEGVGDPDAVGQQQLSGPCIAREHAVLVVMDDQATSGAEMIESNTGPAPRPALGPGPLPGRPASRAGMALRARMIHSRPQGTASGAGYHTLGTPISYTRQGFASAGENACGPPSGMYSLWRVFP